MQDTKNAPSGHNPLDLPGHTQSGTVHCTSDRQCNQNRHQPCHNTHCSVPKSLKKTSLQYTAFKKKWSYDFIIYFCRHYTISLQLKISKTKVNVEPGIAKTLTKLLNTFPTQF